jgi:cytochrome c biogenesis protein ResB
MEAGKAIGSGSGAAIAGRLASLVINPLRAVWWLFANVRFGTVLLVLLALASLLGVVIPQVPLNVRGDVVAEAQWLDSKEGTFGALTDPMGAIGLFDVFHAAWFKLLMATTVASTTAYILSRLPGIWMSITRPRQRVPDSYFDVAPNRFATAEALDPAQLEAALKRQRYRVARFEEGGVAYLFADRFASAQLGTLLTHAAVIVFILSAVVSRMDAFESGLFLAEGSTLPVFPVRNPEQVQVELVDAVGEFSDEGQALDYRSQMVIYKNGEEVKRCSSTVNSPCSYEGYRFYQAAYFGFGAAVQVRDLATGNVLYRETLALVDRAPSPRVLIQDADGRTLVEAKLVLTDELDTGDVAYRGTLVELPEGRLLTVGLESSGDETRLAVLETERRPDSVSLLLREGETGESGGLRVTYVKESMTPAARVDDLPLPPGSEGAFAAPYLQLSNVVYGTGRASEGTAGEPPAADGPPALTLSGLGVRAAELEPGESVDIGGYEYTFLGQREFSGINVKRDRSNYLVWSGAAMIVVGLMVTFWVPRRRLWAKISNGGSVLVGQAPGHARYAEEMRRLALRAGADSGEETQDDD